MKRRQIQKLCALLQYVWGISILTLLAGSQAFAATPKFVTGTEKLVADLTKYGLGLVAAVTGALLVKTGYQWNIADVDEKPKHKKSFFSTLFVGVGIMVAGSLVAWVFSYYQ